MITALKYILMTVISTATTLVLMPVILPIILLFWLSWICARFLIAVAYRGKASMVKGTDVIHGKERFESKPIINVAARIHGRMDVDKITAKVESILLNSYDKRGRRRYRRMMMVYAKAFGYYIFKDIENFDVKNHVKLLSWKDIGVDNCTKIQMEDVSWEQTVKMVLKKFGMRPFEEGTPQWEILLLEHSPDRYSAFWRIHHAISDGMYLLRMFAEEFVDQPIKLFSTYTTPPLHIRVMTGIWSFCLLPVGILKAILNYDDNPLHGPKLTGKKRFFISQPIPIQTLQEIKKKSEVSLNSILFSCVSYALSCHLSRKSSNVTKLTTLTTVPLHNPLRPIKLKNKFAVGSIRLPVPKPEKDYLKMGDSLVTLSSMKCSEHIPLSTKHSDSMSRLKAVHETLMSTKQDPSILAANTFMNMLCALCPATLAEAILSVKGCTLCISNMPGPPNEVSIWSGQQEDFMFWVPDRTPMGVGVSLFSYKGYLRAGLIMDAALIQSDSEGDLIMEEFENEVRHILYEIEESTNQNVNKKLQNDLSAQMV